MKKNKIPTSYRQIIERQFICGTLQKVRQGLYSFPGSYLQGYSTHAAISGNQIPAVCPERSHTKVRASLPYSE